MRIAFYHGYELTGSGSNEYTRYLADALLALGHEISIICAEPAAEALSFVRRVVEHDGSGLARQTFVRPGRGVTVHRLPTPPIYPVYVTDKQRPGHVKAFVDLHDDELATYCALMQTALAAALAAERPDVLFVNHVVMQPPIAARVTAALGIPFVVVPHGSALEYAVRPDPRYREAALEGLRACKGVVFISTELRERLYALMPELTEVLARHEHFVGVGTDTSRFAPIAPADRGAALRELAELHRSGGKTPEQRAALCTALASGDLDATRRFWDAYDHALPDEDLPATLAELPDDEDLVLFMGALTWGKGVQTLVAAMPTVLLRRPNARLLVVGSGTWREVLEALVFAIDSGDESLLATICRRGRALERDGRPAELDDLLAHFATVEGAEALRNARGRLQDRVRFVGRLDHARLRLLLPLARLTVFPSIVKEASPLVLTESLSAGVLPAGADHSGFATGLRSLADALPSDLLDAMRLPTDPATRVRGIAERIVTLLDRAREPELPAKLRAVAVERYDWSIIARGIEMVASSVISEWSDRVSEP
jgi:glycosyltransferase involved in cell wall biosynthesis